MRHRESGPWEGTGLPATATLCGRPEEGQHAPQPSPPEQPHTPTPFPAQTHIPTALTPLSRHHAGFTHTVLASGAQAPSRQQPTCSM